MSVHPAVIVDTHVVVAGLLTRDSLSPVARILDGMLSAAFAFAVSEALLAEYHEVLTRPTLRKLHGLTASEVDDLLTDMTQHAIVLTPAHATTNPPAPDPGDQLLWNLLGTRRDLLLVKGDKLLLRNRAMQGRVISPRDFLAE